MMKRMFFSACIFFSCLTAGLRAQDTVFWFVAPHLTEELDGGNTSNYPAFLALSNNSFQDARVEITLYNGGSVQTFSATVPAGGLYRHDFDTQAKIKQIENPRGTAGSVVQYGTLITSDVPVTAYYMMNGAGSKDIFTLKGRQALGTGFYVPMQSDNAAPSAKTDAYDQIDIVATEDDTHITVTPTAAIRNGTSGSFPANTPRNYTLDRGQTLKIMEHTQNSYPSLAGTKIVVTNNKPVAVTVTEDWVKGDTSGDQIVPVGSLGTRYVAPKGYRTGAPPDRFYLTGTSVSATTVDIYATAGASTPDTTIILHAAGYTARYDFPASANAVYVEATAPVYLYQRSGYGEEGAALLPSVYAIGQTRLSYYQVGGSSVTVRKGFLLFRSGAEDYFRISYGNTKDATLSVGAPLPVPHEDGWKVARFDLPAAADHQAVTIENARSPFSFGYITGTGGNNSYGYFSAFGSFEFPAVTWMCSDRVTLQGGYAKSHLWTFPNGSTATTSSIDATEEGAYTLVMNQDPNLVTATTVVQRVNAGAVSPAYQMLCTAAPPVTLQVAGAAEPAGTQYQWQSNTTDPADEAAWADIQNATTASYTPPSSPQTVWYRRGMSSDVCAMAYTGSAQVSPCTVPVNPHLRTRVAD